MKITSLCIVFCIAISAHLNAMNNKRSFDKNTPKIMSLQLGIVALKKSISNSPKSNESNKKIEEYHKILNQLNCLKSQKN